MARVKPEEIIEDLSYQMKRALEDAVKQVLPDAKSDRDEFFRAFKRAVGRKCNTWETVSDTHVETK